MLKKNSPYSKIGYKKTESKEGRFHNHGQGNYFNARYSSTEKTPELSPFEYFDQTDTAIEGRKKKLWFK